jgi:hypothetical protein
VTVIGCQAAFPFTYLFTLIWSSVIVSKLIEGLAIVLTRNAGIPSISITKRLAVFGSNGVKNISFGSSNSATLFLLKVFYFSNKYKEIKKSDAETEYLF